MKESIPHNLPEQEYSMEVGSSKDVDLKSSIAVLEAELLRTEKGSRQRELKRLIGTRKAELARLEGNFPGRHIPEDTVLQVVERDRGRDFGRPGHQCAEPGPPHHIRHFSDLKGSEEKEKPHTVENLEAPCKDCHNLAHAMSIQSGVSVETFFRKI